jgi:aryl-alcohol dehydrogenase-like predicted oxidoreductase
MTYGSLGGGMLTGKITKPIVNGGKEQRSGFYNFYEEPMWTRCNKVLDVIREIANGRGVQVSEVSLNWVLAQKGVTSTLMGPTEPKHAIENVKAADWELTPEEVKMIDDAYAKYML